MDSKYNYCFVSERTDVGCKRKANEDNLVHFECPNGLVATVCDGMGGHVGGAVASQVAVDAIRAFLTDNYFDSPQEAIGMAIDAANKAILARVMQQPELQGMGSTCVMLIVRDGKVYIGSVGDSRIYLIRSRRIMQLTKDQSFVQLLVDRGEITKEQAEHHPRKNEITNCLGIADMRAATVLPDAIIPEAGDCFLLCSDGLSGMVSDDRIEHIVSQQGTYTSQQRVDQLVELARQNGGLDNITVQIVEFAVSPAAVQKKRIPAKWLIGAAAALLIIAACAGLYAWLGNKPANDQETVVVDDTVRVTFKDVPFAPETRLCIIPGAMNDSLPSAARDTIVLQVKDQEDQVKLIAKQPDLFNPLKAQLQGAELTLSQDSFIIYSFDKLAGDTLAIVLEGDSLPYKIQVVKEVAMPATLVPQQAETPAPAATGKGGSAKPAPKDNGSLPGQVKDETNKVLGVEKVEEQSRSDLEKKEQAKKEQAVKAKKDSIEAADSQKAQEEAPAQEKASAQEETPNSASAPEQKDEAPKGGEPQAESQAQPQE